MKAFSNGEYDIIIGTQMVAKGLDFENVTLVGVLSADQVLYSDDFRSNERGFDLLTQVVGRSGRGTKRAEQSYKRIRRRILSLHLRRIRTMFIFINRRFCSAKQCFIRRLQILS